MSNATGYNKVCQLDIIEVKKAKSKKSLAEKCIGKIRTVSSCGSLVKLGKANRNSSTSITISEDKGSDSSSEEFMAVSKTLSLDVLSTIDLRPSLRELEAKEAPQGELSQPSKVTFGPEVSVVEMPKYRDIPELKAGLWFTNEEMRKMKLSTLINKR